MILKDDKAEAFMKALKESKLQPYAEEKRENTNKELEMLIEWHRRAKEMKEYIEREALERDLIDNKNFYPAIVKHSLENIPAADVKEVVHASWERPVLMYGHWYRRCTNCFCDSPHGAADNKDYMPLFCSNCGAQMDLIKGDVQCWFPASIEPEVDELVIVKDEKGHEYNDHLWDGYHWCEIVVNDDDTWDGWASNVDVVSWRYKQRDERE